MIFASRKLSFFAIILLSDFSEIFDMLKDWHVFLFFRELKKNIQKNFELSKFPNYLTQHEVTSKKTIVYGYLQHGIKQNFITFVILKFDDIKSSMTSEPIRVNIFSFVIY